MQMVESIKKLLNTEEKKESPLISVIKEARSDVKKQLEKCKNAHTLYLAMLDEETYASEMEWVGKYQGIYLHVCKLAGEGDIHDYPRFKTDFKKQVAPEFTSSESTAYALRSCLGKVPYEIVKNIDDDVTKMWERLDGKYGKTSTLTDVIMNQIKKFKTIRDENDKRFFEFVDIIERGHRDLERMNVEYELSNTTVISIIEEKLPRVIRREWSREVNEEDSNVEGSNKFKSLLKFLLEQKRILDYDSADVRWLHQSSSGQTHHLGRDSDKDEESEEETTTRVISQCLIHTTSAHSTAKCRVYNSKTPKEKVDFLRTKRACWSYLKIDHRSADCKSKKECNEEGCFFHLTITSLLSVKLL